MKLTSLTRLAAVVALAASAAACTPNDKTTTTDSTTSNAAAAADTTGAHNQVAQDQAGVQMDSASTKASDATAGGSPATDAATSQGQTK
ncbi:hypothetical protein GKZ68_16300 [Hymenobacter sp. BRD128]|uniref:hypothetical protein n=1 Tax=Hymenobacter sp. BRD128 TaxID=2675878 RepID=UPI0015666158|nr:hypothetical protein [Hymenobacter sp. BRD128]QKG58044.1 hypothetical protein GKZ68_16300 [Hymenobacter sp. BRD128]